MCVNLVTCPISCINAGGSPGGMVLGARESAASTHAPDFCPTHDPKTHHAGTLVLPETRADDFTPPPFAHPAVDAGTDVPAWYLVA